MIFGGVMRKIRHGVGCCTVAIFGVYAMWAFFQSLLASNLCLQAIYSSGSKLPFNTTIRFIPMVEHWNIILEAGMIN
jgi:hypothetical protein